MAPYRVLIVDDERPARAKVARLLEADQRFEVVGEARHGLEALEQIEALVPDLLILDIQMPGANGFEVLDAVGFEPSFAVVFSTAHDEHALRAFDAHAVDYLLKPYPAERLQRALDKAVAQLAARDGLPSLMELIADARRDPALTRLVLKTDSAWVPVEVGSILRLTAANKYVEVAAEAGAKHLVRSSLSAMERRLEACALFVRVHRSELINMVAVTHFEPTGHGDGLITLRDGSCVVLSRTYRKPFFAWLRRQQEPR